MKSRGTPRFWAAYRTLPPDVKECARQAYRLFQENPAHPSLHFKKVSDRDPVYSARVTINYRVVGLLEGGLVTWFWIGNHEQYDRLLKSL